MNKQNKQTHRHTQQYGGYQKEEGSGEGKRVNRVKYMMMEGDQTLGAEHTLQYTNEALQNGIPKTYMMLLNQCYLNNLINK